MSPSHASASCAAPLQPAEFIVARRAPLNVFLQGMDALYDSPSNRWRASNNSLIQIKNNTWYDFRHAQGGVGPISLAQRVYHAKTPAEAVAMIRAACPAPFIAEEETQALIQDIPSPPRRAAKGSL